MYVCMHAWMYVCMCVCMYVWMDGCMYGWMDGCMYECMDVCMHVCMYVLFIIKLARFLCLMVNDCDVSLLQFMLPSLQLVGDDPPPKKKQPTQNNGVEKTSIYKQSALTTEYWILSDLLNLSEGWRVMKTPMDLEILRSFSIQKPRLLAGVDQDHACVSLQPTITTTDLTTNSGQWRNNEHVFELVNNQPTTYYMTKTHGQIIMTTVEDFVLFVLVVAVFVFLFVFFLVVVVVAVAEAGGGGGGSNGDAAGVVVVVIAVFFLLALVTSSGWHGSQSLCSTHRAFGHLLTAPRSKSLVWKQMTPQLRPAPPSRQPRCVITFRQVRWSHLKNQNPI